MIKNHNQYVTTLNRVSALKTDLERLDEGCPQGMADWAWEALRDGIRSQLSTLTGELQEYDNCTSGRPNLSTNSLAGLGRLLIRARLARGLSQEALAERLGLHQQQVQRYEDIEYASASYERLADVANALEVEVTISLKLKDRGATW